MVKDLTHLGAEFNEHSGARPSLEAGLNRAADELQEALEALRERKPGFRLHVLEEMADVILTLASAAAWAELDLDAGIESKHRVNLLRRWEAHPQIEGAVKHIKVKG